MWACHPGCDTPTFYLSLFTIFLYFKIYPVAQGMAGAGVCRVQQLVTQAKATFSLAKTEQRFSQELEKLRTIVSSLHGVQLL